MSQAVAYIVTLVMGSLAAFFINPLSLLVYLFIWFDVLVLGRISMVVRTVGLELFTLSAIISGIALGPVIGFFFSLIGIPLLTLAIYGAVYRSFTMYLPSFDFVAMAFAAAFAGFLAPQMPFLAAVFIAVFFKHVVMNVINLFMHGGIDYASPAVNIIFTTLFILLLKEMGLLAVFV